jgi:hypothetical protein
MPLYGDKNPSLRTMHFSIRNESLRGRGEPDALELSNVPAGAACGAELNARVCIRIRIMSSGCVVAMLSAPATAPSRNMEESSVLKNLNNVLRTTRNPKTIFTSDEVDG